MPLNRYIVSHNSSDELSRIENLLKKFCCERTGCIAALLQLNGGGRLFERYGFGCTDSSDAFNI